MKLYECMITVLCSALTLITQDTSANELNFACDGDGHVASITDPLNKTDTIVLLDEAKDNPCHITESTCYQTKKNKIHVMYDVGNTNSGIIEGKSPKYYELECKAKNYIETAVAQSFEIKTITPNWTPQINNLEYDKMKLEIFGEGGNSLPNEIYIGSKLQLKITGPANTYVSPVTCLANGGSQTNYTIWAKCKSSDQAIIDSSKWTKTNNGSEITIGLYAFRFVESATVTISCSAMICPGDASTCQNAKVDTATWCMGTNIRRRRRSAEIRTKDRVYLRTDSESVSFTVVDRNIGLNKCTGLSSHIALNLSALLICYHVINNLF